MDEPLLAKCGCGHCGNHLEFPIEAVDAVVTCPHCSQPTRLTLEAPPSVSDKPSAASLLAAFAGPVARTPASFFYQVGLVLVSLMMILLPLVYVAMVLAAGWGVYAFATHFAWLLKSLSGGVRFYFIKLLVYLGPLFVGCVLVFFMIKPLFARRRERSHPLAMNPGVESTLYAFIARICDLVGAPMPTRIDLDCQLNASAGFRRGALSMFGNDLVLTIGVPLAAGLNLREFAGVIAHEFGHFTQGFGLRLSYLIRTINDWFFRVACQRDAWDVTLEAWSMEAEEGWVMLVAGCARLAVGFSRLLLKLLMFLGHGVSCFLLRQMEYDADSYEIKLAGSETFEATARKFAVLKEAMGKTYHEIRATWNTSRRLPENLPAFLLQQGGRITDVRRQRIQDTLGLAKTGLLDTHPSDGDRIKRARQAAEPGVFHLDLPATVLFSNFAAVSKQVTQLHYREDLELDFDPATLRPVDGGAVES